MGQTCTRSHNDVADDDLPPREKAKDHKKKTHASKGAAAKPTPKTPANQESSEQSPQDQPQPQKEKDDPVQALSCDVRIEALRHMMVPEISVVSTDVLDSRFRQFSGIFARGKSISSVRPCDRFPSHANQVLIAGEERSIVLLNYETGHVVRRWRNAHNADITCLSRPSEDGIFVTGGRDKAVRVWKLDVDECVATLSGHTLNVSGVAFCGQPHMVVSAGRDNTVRLWDINEQAELACEDIKLNIAHFVSWVPSIGCVAQGGEDLTVRLWDVRTSPKPASLELRSTMTGFDYHPLCVDCPDQQSGHGYTMFTGHNGFNNRGSQVLEWDLRMEKVVRELKGHKGSVRAVKYLNNGTVLQNALMSSGDDEIVHVWDTFGVHKDSREVPHDRISTPTDSTDQDEEIQKSESEEDPAPASGASDTLLCTSAFPEGRITCLEETGDGTMLASTAGGCVVVFTRCTTQAGVQVPVMRYRYVGPPGLRAGGVV